jgi:hypothetical protein
MLINKGFSSGDIVSIKLVNGDEIITRFESETTDEVSISKPLALTMSGKGLGMIPWVFLAETNTLTLKKTHIFCMATSKKDAADQYMEGTTGIALA